MTLRVTLDQPGNPRRKTGVPDEEIPTPWGFLAGRSPASGGQMDSAAGQMFDKTKAEK